MVYFTGQTGPDVTIPIRTALLNHTPVKGNCMCLYSHLPSPHPLFLKQNWLISSLRWGRGHWRALEAVSCSLACTAYKILAMELISICWMQLTLPFGVACSSSSSLCCSIWQNQTCHLHGVELSKMSLQTLTYSCSICMDRGGQCPRCVTL